MFDKVRNTVIQKFFNSNLLFLRIERFLLRWLGHEKQNAAETAFQVNYLRQSEWKEARNWSCCPCNPQGKADEEKKKKRKIITKNLILLFLGSVQY